MPKYEDLDFLKDRILSYGNEVSIKDENNIPLNIAPLPELIAIDTNEDLDDIDSLLDDIKEDFEEGLGIDEDLSPIDDEQNDLDSFLINNDDENKLSSDLSDENGFDINSIDSITEDDNAGINWEDVNEEEGGENWDNLKEDSFKELDSMNINDTEPILEDNDGSLEMGELLSEMDFSTDDKIEYDLTEGMSDEFDMNTEDLPEYEEVKSSEIIPTDIIKEEEIPDDLLSDTSSDSITKELEETGNEEPPINLLDNENSTDKEEDISTIDDYDYGELLNLDNQEEEQEQKSDFSNDLGLSSVDDNLNDFLESMGNVDIDNNLITGDQDLNLDAEMTHEDVGNVIVTEDQDLLNLAGDFASISSEDNTEDLSVFNEDDLSNFSIDNDLNPISDLPINDTDKNEINNEDNANFDNIGLVDIDNAFDNGTNEEVISDLDFGDDLGIVEDLNIESPENIGEDIGFNETEKTEEKTDTNLEDFGFADLESFTVDNFEQQEDFSQENFASEEFVVDEPEITEEVSDDSDNKDDKKDKEKQEKEGDDEFQLSDEERKKVIMTLSTLPKEAELKIANQIINEKFSDKQLKPLIDALINKEKINAILKIYEKITGDTSLSKIQAVKFTGQEFEEKQKSLGYLFQKNILPILSRIAAIAIIILSIIVLYVKIIQPTMEASKNYKMGKKNIKERNFDNVEKFFDRAYTIQPRYGEALDYARKYRNEKRYINAEKKYDLAYKMKPGKNLKLEMSDFYREIKDYQRAVKSYNELRSQNRNDLKTLLGLAETYFEWSDYELDKLSLSKEIYFDILDIDKKNKDAVFGKLEIAIKEKDDVEVMKHYKFIEKEFKEKINTQNYLNLAGYFLKTNRAEDVQNVLNKASKAAGNTFFPEMEYYFAKYKKMLNIFNEEKIHLENALLNFDRLSRTNPDLYNSKKYRNILSNVYNDLGENYDRFSKSNIEAEKYFLKSIETNPENSNAYYNLGNFSLKYKVDIDNAMNNFLEAEKLGYKSDRLTYNLGWINYKKENYLESFKRINSLLERFPDNSNLKLFIGTIFFKLGNYDYAEAFLLESFNHFNNLKQIFYPLEMDINEDKMIAEMLVNVSNNLGAAYQKKYERTKNSKFVVWATKYYSDSIEYYDKLKESKDQYLYETNSTKVDKDEARLRKFQITDANQNLRMVLYPDAGKYEPIIFEDFPLSFESYM